MEKSKLVSIEIWNDVKLYLGPTLNFLDTLVSTHTKLEIARYENFRFIVSGILRKRIEGAYPGSRGKLYVELYLVDGFLEVSIRDKGVPGWQDFSYDTNRIGKDKKDFKNYMLDLCTDGVGMEKLGKEGQRIYIRLKINNQVTFEKPEPYQEVEALDTNISIRPVLTHADAIEAIRCIYSEYGYSYSYEGLYYIDTFMNMIEKKQLMSFLAVNEHGQTAGHFALVFSDLYKNMPEISTVVILKEFRGLGLFAQFVDYCIQISKENNFRALMGQPVAFHPMSQKAFLRGGFTATSLLMSYLGTDLESEYNKDNERLDLCASVRIMDKSATTRIYPPQELITFIGKIYDRMGWQYEFCQDYKVGEDTWITVENSGTLQVTKIIIKESAEDLEDLLKDAIKETIRNKNEMIELVMLLNSPSCEYGYQIAKKSGFVVSGVIPGGENGDYLIMQMLTGDQMNYDKLVMVGEFEELKNDIINLNSAKEE